MTVIGPIDSNACGCDCEVLLDGLTSFDEAERRVMTLALPGGNVEILPLAKSAGRVLVQPVSTATALPRFDNSTMDGYAIRLDDLSVNGPWSLHQAGHIAAGSEGAQPLAPGLRSSGSDRGMPSSGHRRCRHAGSREDPRRQCHP